jgi:hypothetical protein
MVRKASSQTPHHRAATATTTIESTATTANHCEPERLATGRIAASERPFTNRPSSGGGIRN